MAEQKILFDNRTPLTLTLTRRNSQTATLDPLQAVPQSASAGEAWTVSDASSQCLIRTVTFEREGRDSFTIGEEDIRSELSGQGVTVTYGNRTPYSIDLYRVLPDGDEQPFAGLEPDEDTTDQAQAGQAVKARALVTQELVAASILGSAPTQSIEITDEFRRAWRTRLEPKGVAGSGLTHPQLVEEVKRTEPPESTQYIHKSVHRCPLERQFNTLVDVTPKRVRISGVTLIWDRGADKYGLMAYEGPGVLNLKALELYADRVVIRSPLRFPRTDITIYARELVFEGDGSLDTSPLPFAAPAVSPYKTDKDYPADENGTPTYRAADGRHGEKAGDIRLYVKRIRQDRPGPKRFICRGSDGQQAEDGGLKPYDSGDDKERPPASKGKSLKPVLGQDITDFADEKYVVNTVDKWRWPTGCEDQLNLGQVVHVTLATFDWTVGSQNESTGFLPSRAYTWRPFPVKTDDWNDARYRDPERKKPGNGEDAYPSGQPGNGGDGGSVVSYLVAAPIGERLCDLEPGQSPTSKKVDGGASGGPNPAYWLWLKIVNKSIFPSGDAPNMHLEPVTAKKGADTPARTGRGGQKGTVKTGDGVGLLWMNPQRPLALDAVLACARDAYRNGHRDQARALIEPYHAAFIRERRAGRRLSAALSGQLAEIVTMQRNLADNLDYYGHPLGWLPRLNMATSYRLWQDERQCASKLLYYASTIEQEWEAIEDQQATLNDASKAIRAELEVAIEDLPRAYTRLAEAKERWKTVKEKAEAQARDVDRLRERAVAQAKDRLLEQRVFSGMCKLAGGLMEAIPVGQPYLGLAGKTLGIVGDFDWNRPNPLEGVSKGLAEIGGAVGTFLDENKDLLVTESSKHLRWKLDEATDAIETLESSVTKYQKDVDKEWVPLRAGEIKALERQIEDIERQITAAANDEKKKEILKQKDATAKEKLAQLRNEKLVQAKERLEKELAGLTKREEQAERERKRELIEKIDAIEAKKQDVEKNVKTYEKDVTAREEKTEKLLTAMKGVGEGLGLIGKGIEALSAAYDEDEVDRLADQILGQSQFREDYRMLLKEMKALNREKAAAVAELSAWTQRIADATAQISSNVSELVALSDQRQAVDDVLDAGVQQYVRDVRKRAQERLLWYQYNFAKAYEYETLQSPGQDFLNLDTWVKRLQEAKRKLQNLKETEPVALEEDDFKDAEELVVQDQLRELARKVVQRRQSFAQRKNKFTVTLKEWQRQALQRRGNLTFSLVRDFESDCPVSFTDVEAKIVNLVELKFKAEVSDPALNLDIEFRHSGESVVRGRDGRYYFFQRAREDEPISWGFVFDAHEGSDGTVTPDEKTDEETNPLFDEDAKVEFREYYPSLFSDITLWLDRSHHDDPKRLKAVLDKITDITDVQFTIEFVKVR